MDIHCWNEKCEHQRGEYFCKAPFNAMGCEDHKRPPTANKEPVAEVPCSAGLSDALDTGDLVNDPLYKALDKLYERGWVDKHKGRDYDPRGTVEWQSVLDLFRLQKADNNASIYKCLYNTQKG